MYIENAVSWGVDRADWVLMRVSDFVVPIWNRLMLANDMYIILGPPLVLLLAFICLRVTYACIANGVGRTAKRFEKQMDGGDKGDTAFYY